MPRIVVNLLLAASGLIGVAALWLYYDHYLIRSFNSEGKAFGPADGVVYNDSAFVWGVVAVIFLAPPIFVLLLRRLRRS